MLEVDGAHGEGGGQLLRMAVALSAMTHTPVLISRIRAGRPNPGLAAQHATAVKALASLCDAETSGLEVGSSTVKFQPGTIKSGRYGFDVGTAGAVTLVLQAILPVAALSPDPVRVRLTGGTDVRWSPPIDYFSRVFLPLLHRIGVHVDIEIIRRGYYPRGGGVVEATIDPRSTWAPLLLRDPGDVQRVRGIAHASNLADDIPKRMRHAALRRLGGIKDAKVEERAYRGEEAVGQGGALVLWAEANGTLLGSDALAERGKPSERVGEEAAASLHAEIESQATLDVHAADQMLVYLARASGPSQISVREISGHMETMMWLLPQFLSCQFQVVRDGSRSRVRVEPQA